MREHLMHRIGNQQALGERPGNNAQPNKCDNRGDFVRFPQQYLGRVVDVLRNGYWLQLRLSLDNDDDLSLRAWRPHTSCHTDDALRIHPLARKPVANSFGAQLGDALVLLLL